MSDYFILAGMWIFYCVIHSFFASHLVKDLFKVHAGDWYRLYRITFSIFSVVLLLPVLWFQFKVQDILLFDQHVISVTTGLLLITAGIMVMAISFRHYDLHEFIGVRQMEGRTDRQPMQEEGILNMVRHPLYSGSILAILGYILFLPYIANFIMGIILILYFLVGIIFEEKKLVIEFGEEYIRYRQEVPAFIPSLKKLFRKHGNPKKK
jgi:methanethiol S-methyltransferase